MILSTHVTRQLWVQLRLLPLLVLPAIVAGLATAVQGPLGAEGGRFVLGIGFALSALLSAALVGAAFADEIGSGAAAWLVVRAVPRTALIGAWLGIPAVAIGAAYVLAGILIGLAIPASSVQPVDPVAFAVVVAAAAAPAVPLTAAALAIGAREPARTTVLATLGLGAILALPASLIGELAVHPASGYWLVAGVIPADRPIAVGLQAIGLCLAVAAAAWVAAARTFQRRDL